MPDGKVILVLVVASVLVAGGKKVVNGAKTGAKAVGHTLHHMVVHPVDSAKNGAAKK